MFKQTIIVFLTLLVLLALMLTSLIIFRNSSGLQSKAITFVVGEPIRTSGTMEISLLSDRFHVALKNYTIHKKETKKTILKTELGTVELIYADLILGKINPVGLSIKNSFFDNLDDLHPLTDVKAEKTALGFNAQGKINNLNFKITKEENSFHGSLGKAEFSGIADDGFSDLKQVKLTIKNKTIKMDILLEPDNKIITLLSPNKKPITVNIRTKDNEDHVDVSGQELSLETVKYLKTIADGAFNIYKKISVTHKTQDGDKKNGVYTFKINDFHKSGIQLGSINAKIKDKGEQLFIDISQSKIAGGTITNNIILPRVKSSKKDIIFTFNDFNYTTLLKAFGAKLPDAVKETGTASLNVKMNISGEKLNEWLKSAKGTVSLNGGTATLDGRLIDLWGAGVFNFLIPSFDSKKETVIECFKLDIDVKDGLVRIDPLILNTKRVLIYGKGTYDLLEEQIDLVLKPSNKNIAIGSLKTDIKISGSISNPTVRPEMIGALKKISGIALGTVIPGFFIFSLADMGISKENPCQK